MKHRMNMPPACPTRIPGAVEGDPGDNVKGLYIRAADPLGGSAVLGRVAERAFTLLELLVVIAIIGILAAIAVPTMKSFKPDVKASATRQLLDDISRARQMAIGQRTTVFMVFVPTNFWNDPVATGANCSWTTADRVQATNLFDKQGIGYNFVTLRSLGDQPGQHTARYLASWRVLPDGAFIPLAKFYDPKFPAFDAPVMTIDTNAMAPWSADISIYRFRTTTEVPFPMQTTAVSKDVNQRFVRLPYIAFNYQGQLVTDQEVAIARNETIPLAKGSVGFSRVPATKVPRDVSAVFTETPPGNATNMYNVINIDSLTGRARVQYLEVR